MSEQTNILRPKALNKVLSCARTGNIKCILLLSAEGSLLAYSGEPDTDFVATAAMASTIWKNHQRCGNTVFLDDKLRVCIVQAQETNMIVQSLSRVLLCLVGDKDVPLGELKIKANALNNHLSGPLKKILKSPA